jgi:uncharacterized protein
MSHQNETLLRAAYTGFSTGDMAPIASLIANDTTWCITGSSPVSGTYTGTDEIFGFFGSVMDLYQGTFRIDARDVLANGDYGVILCTEHGIVHGELLEFSSVHVWKLRNGKCTQFMSYEDDIYHKFWSEGTLRQVPADLGTRPSAS